MADAATWVELVVGSGIIGIAAKGSSRLWSRLIERPLEKAEERAAKAETERDEYKRLWKEEQLAREKRIADQEVALFGRPSERPRERLNTLALLVESTRQQEREAELQSRMLEDRARELPRADPLEAFAPGPSVKDRLPVGAGRTDYDERRQRNAQQGFDTPTEYRPRQTTHRERDDNDTPREPVAGRRPKSE